MEDNKVSVLQNEFFTEIRNKNIKITDLKKVGVSDTILKEEVILRNVYGDKIFIADYDSEQVDVSKKAVTKVDLKEIEKIDEVKLLLDELSSGKVNSNIDFLVTKLCKKG